MHSGRRNIGCSYTIIEIYLLKYTTKDINASNMLFKAVQKPSHFIREQMSKREIKEKVQENKIHFHNDQEMH